MYRNPSSPFAYRHCEYQSLTNLHVYGEAHVLQPV
jgi:hypothetical protein